MNIKKAIKILCKNLGSKQDYFYGWQSNIAMAIFDEWERSRKKKKYLNRKDRHRICNYGAINFLDLLCRLNEKQIGESE